MFTTLADLAQYFYLFTNIGALIGQLTMAYSEKVRLLVNPSEFSN